MSDNTMAAYEMTLHTMNYGLNGKKAYMTIKLDMSKAYDHVEWYFLKLVMEKMSFNKKWIDLIMECIMFVSYSLLVNG